MKNLKSPNFDERKLEIDMLVLHYTGRPSLNESLDWMCDPSKKVSAHYCVAEDGEIFRLVDEKHRAWHAGQSFWAGETDLNSCSIGIELQNPGHEFGYQDFPDAQIEALIELSSDIITRHYIPDDRVLGHSDIAPLRKLDPGEKFPWGLLAGEGIGHWPDFLPMVEKEPGIERFAKTLGLWGFDVREKKNWGKVIEAFQRHWHQENITGKPDLESYRRLIALIEQN